jgi:uncharacterized protein
VKFDRQKVQLFLKIALGLILIVSIYIRYSTGDNDALRYANGQLKSYGSFSEGKAEGTWTWWFENGNKMSEGNFVGGKRNGEWITWFENGNMKSKGHYKNDRLNGAFIEWFDNGGIAIEASYAQDKLEGSRRNYDEQGQLTRVEEFRAGKRVEISDLEN